MIESIPRSSVSLDRFVCSRYFKNIQRDIFMNSINFMNFMNSITSRRTDGGKNKNAGTIVQSGRNEKSNNCVFFSSDVFDLSCLSGYMNLNFESF